MRYQTITVESRNERVTQGTMAKQRADGSLPGVLSRPGKDPITFKIATTELQHAVRKAGVGGIMELVEEGGAKHLGILKELQWHPVTKKIQHASFQEVQTTQVVNTSVPLVFVGEPAAIKAKTGQLIKNMEQIDVHGRVDQLPDHITVDLGDMELGDVLLASGVPLPTGITAVHPDHVIASVSLPTVVSLDVPTSDTDAVGAIKEAEDAAAAATAEEEK